jgi:hypothetical protein
MNELNYASLEASQRLSKAGIVLKTEMAWGQDKNDPPGVLILWEFNGVYPAPSIAEVWRELPFQSYIKMLDEGSSLAWIFDEERKFESPEIWNTNPTDALIDLLIWVTEQRKEKV